MLGDALGDPSLAVAVWDSDSRAYADVHGARLALPRAADRGVITITENGSPVAAVIHDPALDTDSDVVEGMVATSMMLLENTRLVEELRESRLRLAETSDRERRRLERDLHDGAQQRLMGIQIKLRVLEESVVDAEISGQLEAIGIDTEAAVEDLRGLAYGIYPPVLRDYGLAEALRSLALRAPMRIAVVDNGIGRCSRAIESAIYFCSMEAIQNVAKHAGDGARTTVTLGREAGRAAFSIADDGIGMGKSAPGRGDGLIGMRDRVGAVGGELRIVSAPDGTTVLGTVPLDRDPGAE
jgi:signal transduction histidine kinase